MSKLASQKLCIILMTSICAYIRHAPFSRLRLFPFSPLHANASIFSVLHKTGHHILFNTEFFLLGSTFSPFHRFPISLLPGPIYNIEAVSGKFLF